MGKVIDFMPNDLMKKYKYVKNSILDFAQKFLNRTINELAICILDEILKSKTSIFFDYSTTEVVGSIFLVIFNEVVSVNTLELNSKDLGEYFDISEEKIIVLSKIIIKSLNLQHIDREYKIKLESSQNDVSMFKAKKILKEILATYEDNNEDYYLEENFDKWVESFYESCYFNELSGLEKENADIIIEIFDLNMNNYIGEDSKQWTIEGVKRCCTEILPNKIKGSFNMIKCVVPVLSSFFCFLKAAEYIDNGDRLALAINEISDTIIEKE